MALKPTGNHGIAQIPRYSYWLNPKTRTIKKRPTSVAMIDLLQGKHLKQIPTTKLVEILYGR